MNMGTGISSSLVRSHRAQSRGRKQRSEFSRARLSKADALVSASGKQKEQEQAAL